jgi:DNA-binding transcriptional regulator YiaG
LTLPVTASQTVTVTMSPEELRGHLVRLRASHARLAERLHCERSTVTKWANGSNPIPWLAAKEIRSLEPEPEDQESEAVRA